MISKTCICRDIKYFKGAHSTIDGVKRDEKNVNNKETRFENLREGHGRIITKRTLELWGEIGGFNYPISIKEFFGEKLRKPDATYGKFTPARIKKIKQTMPEQVTVESKDGKHPFQVCEQDLNAWWTRLQQIL